MQDVLTRRAIDPQDFAGVHVEGDEAGSIRLRKADVTFIHAVSSVHEERVTGERHAARAHVVLRDAELGHHVQFPDDVRFMLFVPDDVRLVWLFGGEWSVVLAIAKTFGVEADHLATAGDEPDSVTDDHRRRANALVRPVMHATGRQLLTGMLPEEFTGLFVEANQAAEIDLGGIPLLHVAVAVVGSDVDFAIRDDWIAVGLGAQLGGPLDVRALFDIPFGRDALAVGDIVAEVAAAPLRPITRLDLHRLDDLQSLSRWIKLAVTFGSRSQCDFAVASLWRLRLGGAIVLGLVIGLRMFGLVLLRFRLGVTGGGIGRIRAFAETDARRRCGRRSFAATDQQRAEDCGCCEIPNSFHDQSFRFPRTPLGLSQWLAGFCTT